MGFALKDKNEPEWDRAEKELTTAITLRGPAKTEGRRAYEFARAICRIHLYQSAPSDALRASILADLKTAAGKWGDKYERDPDISKWLAEQNLMADAIISSI